MECCQTLADTFGNALQAGMVVVCVVLPNRVANTWLSVWPVMADAVFMLSFHNVFLASVRYAFCTMYNTS